MSSESNSSKQKEFNYEALEPLFSPWEEPTKHRRRPRPGEPHVIESSRRYSPLGMVNPIRDAVGEWRKDGYPGIGATSRTLLEYWFEGAHRREEGEFQYYFCQREVIETLIFLMEVRGLRSQSSLISKFGDGERELVSRGIDPTTERWSRYAFKLATGTGKTKCMSLAIVWSYFRALYESDSEMAKHFVVVAPNLSVFDRLRQDFNPEEGSSVFETDPLIPPQWKKDWDFSVVLQDDIRADSPNGALYLTNIHRLYDPETRRKAESEWYPWAGPAVSVSQAFGGGQELRKCIASHKRLMVLNDEAHHVWDQKSVWNSSIEWLHEKSEAQGGSGLVAQLDFSATPKDDKGNYFSHIVCDTPLGEAVDAAIVKIPVIGHAELEEVPVEDAGRRYDKHLQLGYRRWQESYEEWKPNGKTPILFVMCENTKAANQIYQRLNSDPIFQDLNKKVINLHTHLKGKIVKRKRGEQEYQEFVESDKPINDEDMKKLRRISRELDMDDSPWRCVVSVLMLREGWDVKNVTTIVPLRPYSSKANILPEQTLGRGLRRMVPPTSNVNERVVVVHHPAFVDFYQKELEEQGVIVDPQELGSIQKTIFSIFPDKKKDWDKLDIRIPILTDAHRIQPHLSELTWEEVEESFNRFPTLNLGDERKEELDYEEKHLITQELVAAGTIRLFRMRRGEEAISFYVEHLERSCKVRSTHTILAPLIKRFLCTLLFEEPVHLNDPRLVARLGNQDVWHFTFATFRPIIMGKVIQTELRKPKGKFAHLRNWKSFPFTVSDRNPVVVAEKTIFNVVPCNGGLEKTFAEFLDRAPDVEAFAKNAGPARIFIDYLKTSGQLGLYIPDFFVRTKNGEHFLVETKGAYTENVREKACAAVEWCKSASNTEVKWEYVFVPQARMEEAKSPAFLQLTSACQISLVEILTPPLS